VYGTTKDLLKAKGCVEGGDPTLIAVRNGNKFTLYQLEQGKFRLSGKNWYEFVGRRVAVTGAVRKKKDASAIRVDALEVLAPSIAEREAANVVGSAVDLTLKDPFGAEQRLSALKGRIVILNFWATYCVPCRKEMPDLAAIQNEYAALGLQVVGASADPTEEREVVAEMGQRLHTQLETFGTCDDARWQARDIDYINDLARFRVWREDREWGEFETPLIGDFNIRNCLATIIAADAWGIEREAIQSALATFQSVRRRMQVRGVERGVTIIDDFAHHPTAVRETLQALRTKYRDRRLVAVFEPRSWSSRLAVFQNDYAQAFASADYVIIASVFDSSKATEKGRVLDTQKLIEDIAAQGKPTFSIAGADGIVSHLTPVLEPGDVVAIMSNGGFGGIHDKLLAALREDSKMGTVT
jgi:thiol-disulfide isomerase/thioredoxin